jgi:hypothetical protein
LKSGDVYEQALVKPILSLSKGRSRDFCVGIPHIDAVSPYFFRTQSEPAVAQECRCAEHTLPARAEATVKLSSLRASVSPAFAGAGSRRLKKLSSVVGKPGIRTPLPVVGWHRWRDAGGPLVRSRIWRISR